MQASPRTRRTAVFLFLACLAGYAAFNYGGIRSPDSEVVFRAGQSLITSGSLAVVEQLPWKGFGTAVGRDGKIYSIFGPLQSLLAAPWIGLAQSVVQAGWIDRLGFVPPISHYYARGLEEVREGKPPSARSGHEVRFLTSFFNSPISALGVALLFMILVRLGRSGGAALFAAASYGFGSLCWPYATTFFSEPLATSLLLLSFYWLLPGSAETPRRLRVRSALSGLALGLATATHLTAVLFAPFWLLLVGELKPLHWVRWKEWIPPASCFLLGLAVPLALLGFYNQWRFGNLFETGRTVDPRAAALFAYGVSVAPWRGAVGLLGSFHKGLLFFNPLVVFSLIGWRRFHRQSRYLSWILATALAFRLMVIASRSDWHGGFSLGPRYLVMALPFLFLPAGSLWEALSKTTLRWLRPAALGLVLVGCLQQLYFCLGEVFSFYCRIRWSSPERWNDDFKAGRVYFAWNTSPLHGLLAATAGPFWLRSTTHLWVWWISLAAVALVLTVLLGRRRNRQNRSAAPGPVLSSEP